MNIVVFDPSLSDNQNNFSPNLGDLIIRKSTDRILQDLFPSACFSRISTHKPPTKELLQAAFDANLCIVAGTNLLSSHVLSYNQWKLVDDPMVYADPPFLRAVLLGVGWWKYQDAPDTVTKYFYQNVLAQTGPHSLRDQYSLNHVKECGIQHLFNTSCPTLWACHGMETSRRPNNTRCLFCLTDYAPDIPHDNALLEKLLELYPDGVLFFPQGSCDLRYLGELDAYLKNKDRVKVLGHTVDSLALLAARDDWDYIGTRLHAGIWCLQQKRNALIVAVDNRASEIGAETGLPIAQRGDIEAVDKWHRSELNGVIRLPLEAIEAWKSAVTDYAAKNMDYRTGGMLRSPARQHPEGRLLNLGCGGRIHKAWVNVDFTETREGVLAHDLTTPFPFEDREFDMVYSSHVLEHFTRKQAAAFLAECHRVLRPGGILRIVVPDFEWLCERYLEALRQARQSLTGSTDASEREVLLARHEYATINCIDQLCRHDAGGEMLRFWKRRPLPAEDYVLETNGAEVLRALIALKLFPSCESAPVSGPEPCFAACLWEKVKKKLGFSRRVLASDDALRLGRFRLSGEAHLWMYDEVYLYQCLEAARFSDIRRQSADVSYYSGFAEFCLDTTQDGRRWKPESLYMECRKAG